MYCGIGPIPKGKQRGTPQYCLANRQVRYYGIEEIEKELLKKEKEVDITKEKLKLKKLEDDGKRLINEYKKVKLILSLEDATKSDKKKALKRIDQLINKRDKLVKNISKQSEYIKTLEKEKKRKEKKTPKKR